MNIIIVIYYLGLIWPMQSFYVAVTEAAIQINKGKDPWKQVRFRKFQKNAWLYAILWPITMWFVLLNVLAFLILSSSEEK
jgi:hypothetical protein